MRTFVANIARYGDISSVDLIETRTQSYIDTASRSLYVVRSLLEYIHQVHSWAVRVFWSKLVLLLMICASKAS